MIWLEFGQVVRVNYLAQLYFVHLVRDGVEVVVVPFEDVHASGKVRVPVRPEPFLLRTFRIADIQHLEVVHAPATDAARGVCGYYDIQVDRIYHLHFHFAPPHWSLRVRVVERVHDQLTFELADPQTQAQAQLPPELARDLFCIDFRFRGIPPELGIRDIVVGGSAPPTPPPTTPHAPQRAQGGGTHEEEDDDGYPSMCVEGGGPDTLQHAADRALVRRVEAWQEAVARDDANAAAAGSFTSVLFPVVRAKTRAELAAPTFGSHAHRSAVALLQPRARVLLAHERFPRTVAPAATALTARSTSVLALPWTAMRWMSPDAAPSCTVALLERVRSQLFSVHTCTLPDLVRLAHHYRQHCASLPAALHAVVSRRHAAFEDVWTAPELARWKLTRAPRAALRPEDIDACFAAARHDADRARDSVKKAVWLRRQYLQPEWARCVHESASKDGGTRARFTQTTSPDFITSNTALQPFVASAVAQVSGRAFPLEKHLLRAVRWGARPPHPRVREAKAATPPSTGGPVAPSSSAPGAAEGAGYGGPLPPIMLLPASLAIRNAKVLACEFASEAELRSARAPFFFDPSLDDLPYAWTARFDALRAQLSPAELLDFVAAVLQQQEVPYRIQPAALILPLATWLLQRRRPVLPGHYARIKNTTRLFVWNGATWARPLVPVDARCFHNVAGIVAAPPHHPAAGREREEQQQQQHHEQSEDQKVREATADAAHLVAVWRANTVRCARSVLARIALAQQMEERPPSPPPAARPHATPWLFVVGGAAPHTPVYSTGDVSCTLPNKATGGAGEAFAHVARLLIAQWCPPSAADLAASHLALPRAWLNMQHHGLWSRVLTTCRACTDVVVLAHMQGGEKGAVQSAQLLMYSLVFLGAHRADLFAALTESGFPFGQTPGGVDEVVRAHSMDVLLLALFGPAKCVCATDVESVSALQRVWLAVTATTTEEGQQVSRVSDVVVTLSSGTSLDPGGGGGGGDERGDEAWLRLLVRGWCGSCSYLNNNNNNNNNLHVAETVWQIARARVAGWPEARRAVGEDVLRWCACAPQSLSLAELMVHVRRAAARSRRRKRARTGVLLLQMRVAGNAAATWACGAAGEEDGDGTTTVLRALLPPRCPPIATRALVALLFVCAADRQ